MFGEKQTHHISTHQQTRTSVHGGHTKTNTQIYVLDNQNDCCCMVDHQIYSNLTFIVSGVLYYSVTELWDVTAMETILDTHKNYFSKGCSLKSSRLVSKATMFIFLVGVMNHLSTDWSKTRCPHLLCLYLSRQMPLDLPLLLLLLQIISSCRKPHRKHTHSHTNHFYL